MAIQCYSITPLPIETFPACLADGVVPAYDDFLAERRLVALRIKKRFEVLS